VVSFSIPANTNTLDYLVHYMCFLPIVTIEILIIAQISLDINYKFVKKCKKKAYFYN